MLKFVIDKDAYYVGHAPALGYLIYDPAIQGGIKSDLVKLFVCDQSKLSNFNKDAIRCKLKPNDKLDKSLSKKLLDRYIELKTYTKRSKPKPGNKKGVFSCRDNIRKRNRNSNSKSIQYIATDNSRNSTFHKSTCGWVANVTRVDEIKFESRADALRQGFVPCKNCRP